MDSSDEEDIHQCGRCKEVFVSLELYFQHKQSKVCKKNKNAEPRLLLNKDDAKKSKEVNETNSNQATHSEENFASLDTAETCEDKNCADTPDVKTEIQKVPKKRGRKPKKLKKTVGAQNDTSEKRRPGRPRKNVKPDVNAEPESNDKETPIIKKRKIESDFECKVKKIKTEVVNKGNGESGEFMCLDCGHGYANKEELDVHKESKKCEKSYRAPYQTRNNKKDITDVRTPEFSCKACDSVFENYEKLKDHASSEHPDLFLGFCMFCGKWFPSRALLWVHISTSSHSTDLTLENLEAVKKTVEELPKAKKSPSASKPVKKKIFMCADCDSQFTSRFLLKKHRKDEHNDSTVPNVRSTACPYCGKDFKRRLEVQLHVEKAHGIMDDESDNCPVCEKTLKSKYHVFRHRENLHTAIGVVEVRDLNQKEMYKNLKSLNSQNGIVQTMNNSSDPAKTSAAEICIKNKDSIKNDEVPKKDPVPFTCFVCHELFASKSGLDRHMECHKVWIKQEDLEKYMRGEITCVQINSVQSVLTTDMGNQLPDVVTEDSLGEVVETNVNQNGGVSTETVIHQLQPGVIANEMQHQQLISNESSDENQTHQTLTTIDATALGLNQWANEQTVLTILQEMGNQSTQQNQNSVQNHVVGQNEFTVINQGQNGSQGQGRVQSQEIENGFTQLQTAEQPVNILVQQPGVPENPLQPSNETGSINVSNNAIFADHGQTSWNVPVDRAESRNEESAAAENLDNNKAIISEKSDAVDEDGNNDENEEENRDEPEKDAVDLNEDTSASHQLSSESYCYMCCDCMWTSANLEEFNKHKTEIHNFIAVFRCCHEACRAIFDKLEDFERHHNEHKQHAFICKICNDHHDSLNNLVAHKSVVHRNVYGIFGFRCPTCHKSFSSKAVLDKHIKKDPHNHVCHECGKVFKGQGDLIEHELKHKGIKSFLCDVCGTSFVNLSALRKHKSNHNPVRSHHCDECGKNFNKREHLKRHIITKHSDEKPYACQHPGCTKAFKRRDKLQEHQRNHSNELPFVCQFCAKGYRHKEALKYHEKTHDRVLNLQHQCDQCKEAFARSSQLAKHLQEVHKVPKQRIPAHKCGSCSLKFHRLERLYRHIEREHGLSVPWKTSCGICGKGFAGDKSLQTHIAKRHVQSGAPVQRKKREKTNKTSVAPPVSHVLTAPIDVQIPSQIPMEAHPLITAVQLLGENRTVPMPKHWIGNHGNLIQEVGPQVITDNRGITPNQDRVLTAQEPAINQSQHNNRGLQNHERVLTPHERTLTSQERVLSPAVAQQLMVAAQRPTPLPIVTGNQLSHTGHEVPVLTTQAGFQYHTMQNYVHNIPYSSY